MKTLIGVTFIAAMLGSCAAPSQQTAANAPPNGRTCFLPRDMESWKEDGTQAVLFSVRKDQTWRARTLGPCLDLDFATKIRLETRIGSWICDGDEAFLDIASPRTAATEQCHLDRFAKLTPEQVSALPEKSRP